MGDSGTERAGAASGAAFVVLFVAGLTQYGDLLGSFGDSDATFDDYFASTARRTGNIVGAVLLGASAFAFIWFLHHLRRWLQPEGTRDPSLPNVMFSTGHIFVALLLTGTAVLVTVPLILTVADAYGEEASVLGSGLALLPQLGFVVLAFFALWAAGVTVGAASVSARRTGSFPRWLCRLGYAVTGCLLLLGMTVGIGFLSLAVWVAAVSLHWFRARAHVTSMP